MHHCKQTHSIIRALIGPVAKGWVRGRGRGEGKGEGGGEGGVLKGCYEANGGICTPTHPILAQSPSHVSQ